MGWVGWEVGQGAVREVGPGGVGLGSVLFVCSKWSAKEDCGRSP